MYCQMIKHIIKVSKIISKTLCSIGIHRWTDDVGGVFRACAQKCENCGIKKWLSYDEKNVIKWFYTLENIK